MNIARIRLQAAVKSLREELDKEGARVVRFIRRRDGDVRSITACTADRRACAVGYAVSPMEREESRLG